MHDHAILERARKARDPRFDGRFFIGVRTTGIYCRPICPARMPRSENVDFFPTAAAASEAGFRPCLRCRPECAPGSPAWHGTSTTVRRGLRLIENGDLDDANVEQLAERLGVTGRHLRRLFRRHLGASPLAVAHTRRLHFAKRLIDETDLPFRDIATAAGYGSIRRFNDAFRNGYGRSPRELRRRAAQPVAGHDAALAIRLPYQRPFPWRQLLDFFALRAVPGVEAVIDDRYLRTIATAHGSGVVELRAEKSANELLLVAHGVATSELLPLIRCVRGVFDLDAPVAEIAQVLGDDRMLKKRLDQCAGVRVPGAWDGFELGVRAVLGQQVTVKAATTLAGRLAARCGSPISDDLATRFENEGLTHRFPTPAELADADLDGLGITGARTKTIRTLAQAMLDGRIDFDAADPEALQAALLALPGIGTWTAEYVTMRAFKDPDAFPASDLGVRRSLESMLGKAMPPKAIEALAAAWRPCRAYAVMLLWSTGDENGE